MSEAFFSRDSALSHQHPKLRQRPDVLHCIIVAEFSLTSEITKIRHAIQCLEIASTQTRCVPEKTQAKNAVESAKTGESLASERTINQKVRRLSTERHQTVLRITTFPRLEIWKVRQQLQTSIC